jgi:hypothetical protein
MSDPFENLQAAARRRGPSLRKDGDRFLLHDSRRTPGPGNDPWRFDDLGEVRDKLRVRPCEAAS